MNTESAFSTVLAMCQQMLILKRKSGISPAITKDLIDKTVEEIIKLEFASKINKDRLQEELEERFTVYIPPHDALGAKEDHIAWLAPKLPKIDWRFWNRYFSYLQKSIPGPALENLEKIVDDVLSRLEDPLREGSWDRRGLVMGHVQSGKTGNYCGLICKAADAGYKVIIVLSGLHNSLRSQTQIRLDDGFLGRRIVSSTAEEQMSWRPCGVGALDPSVKADPITNRAQNGDFNKRVADQFGIHPGGNPLLFVVKKNVTVLNNLLRWLRSCASDTEPETGRRLIKNVAALVVDDEADLASIDTQRQMYDGDGQPDPTHNPTKINSLIRKILRSFEKVAYVGYTATPFANIFIHSRGSTPELGPDLFPRSFIINLPAPSNYMGAERILGISSQDDPDVECADPLPLFRPVTDHAETDKITEQHGWMPPLPVMKTEHRPRYDGNNSIPPSLREAIMAFILAIVVRRLRESSVHHNSMLVHVTRFTKVQGLIAEQLEVALKEFRQRLQYGDCGRKPSVIEEFKILWETDFVPTSQDCRQLDSKLRVGPLPDWADVVPLLRDVTVSIVVKKFNGTVKDVLDYEEHREKGLNVLAVGGDKLSRGLTLEGLSVSYFLRASRMYDTLMQMGRWFGYRDKYVDLCRLYTTSEIWEWFGYIAEASKELEKEFHYMAESSANPDEYGLKVRAHPVMRITSAIKMRHGMEMQLSYSGDVSQTIIFRRNIEWVTRNFTVTENFLASIGEYSRKSDTKDYIWVNVSSEKITDFLASYETVDTGVRSAKADMLAKYIHNRTQNGELGEWTVQLCFNSDATRIDKIGELSVGLNYRSQYPKSNPNPDRCSIRQLVSGNDEKVDLSQEQLDLALQKTIVRWESNTDPAKKGRPKEPGRREVREERPKTNGVLLLYPLNPDFAGFSETVKPVIGLAVSFPLSEIQQPITYRVNNVGIELGVDYDCD